MSRKKVRNRAASEIVQLSLSNPTPVGNTGSGEYLRVSNTTGASRRGLKILVGIGVLMVVVVGVFAANGWLPRNDASTGRNYGWFGRELPKGFASAWNPFTTGGPPPTLQLSKEYVYAGDGSRVLAVEDSNASIPYMGLEGDVAPRPNGDGVLLASDVQQVQRFFSGEDTPTASECQRADTALRNDLGSGGLNSADYQQVYRYVGVLDPRTATGGPACGGGGGGAAILENSTAEAEDPEKAAPAIPAENASPSVPNLERGVRIGTAIGRRGQAITLPVLMNLRVGETVATFTLEYDDARFSNPRVSLGPNLPSRTFLTINTRHPGKIGVVVGTESNSFAAVPVELPLVFVTFDIRNTAAAGSVSISLTDSLVKKGVADYGANLVTTRYTNGSVSITF